MTKIVLLHGGGLDSSAVFIELVASKQDFEVMHVNYGQIASSHELAAVTKQCEKYQVPLSTFHISTVRALNPGPNKLFDGVSDKAYIESRNLALILLAHKTFPDAEIWLGFDKPVTGVPFPDCSIDFIKAVESDFGIRLRAPFIDIDKDQVCGAALEFDSDFYENSMTCWTPTSKGECGECKHCKIKNKLKLGESL